MTPFLRAFSIIAILLLSSCDISKILCHTPFIPYEPIYLSWEEVRTLENQAARDLEAPGKIYIHGDYLLINEQDKGIHIIDNSDATAPKNMGFLAIPGNREILVRERDGKRILYADNYLDLVALDFSDPLNVRLSKRFELLFQHSYYGYDEEKGIIIGYKEGEEGYHYHDCGVYAEDATSAPSGDSGTTSQGGSLAGLAALGNAIFAVDGSFLQVLTIDELENPKLFNRKHIDWGIETIFPHEDKLFLGGNQGMYIYDASDPTNIKELGRLEHVQACDPVVVQDDIAYVTLQGRCFGQDNELQIIDISDPTSPELLHRYAMQEPFGLGVRDEALFICDGASGLKVYGNAKSNPGALELLHHYDEVDARDVILLESVAIVIAENGLFQYDYSQALGGRLELLSSILVKVGE